MDIRTKPAPRRLKFDERIQALLLHHAKRQDDITRKQRVCASQLIEWVSFGLAATNMARIAERAGVSTATLYRLYPDRNYLTVDALKLGNKVLLETIQEAPRHPHPFRDLVEIVDHLLAIYRESSVLMLWHTQAFILQSETETFADVQNNSALFIQELQEFFFNIIDRLVSDGFIQDNNRLSMFLRIQGAIEDKTVEWQGRFKVPFQPVVSWSEEAVKIAEEFFIVHGTAKFRALRQQDQVAWLDGKSLQKKALEPVDETRLQASIDRQLPFLRDVEASLRAKPRPATTDAFIWQELERFMSKSGNRLDASNRRSRIVASAIVVNYSQGFQNVNMAAVAKQAGVSTATLYRLYPDDRALYEAAHGLGTSFYMAWLAQESTSPNPLVQFCEYTSISIETFLDPRVKNAISMGAFTNALQQLDEHLSIGDLIVIYTNMLWRKRFARLLEEGFIDQPPSWDMLHALQGTTSAINGLYLRHGIQLQPNGSWFAECRTVVDEFFQIYGTPHFHAMRKKMNWDEDLALYKPGEVS